VLKRIDKVRLNEELRIQEMAFALSNFDCRFSVATGAGDGAGVSENHQSHSTARDIINAAGADSSINAASCYLTLVAHNCLQFMINVVFTCFCVAHATVPNGSDLWNEGMKL
jgi:hypothetical protein